ncbi:hypothetical protein [uncultured Thiocystis sp.]|jgi:hypothetical protein|uniref:hypothetical protein n=1 Tax=uncultured Thiocystis sp. TaxID=1202134 RepID=UPI0025FE8180|nr:hypothetical protein [uncultured Thiocystis sp.]
MPTTIPSGPFLWRAQVTGDLCDCAVDWAWDFTPGDGFEALPPRVVPCGRYVLVTAVAAEGSSSPDPVSPGVLTLTAAVACGDETTTLDPIYLTITEEGVSGEVLWYVTACRNGWLMTGDSGTLITDIGVDGGTGYRYRIEDSNGYPVSRAPQIYIGTNPGGYWTNGNAENCWPDDYSFQSAAFDAETTWAEFYTVEAPPGVTIIPCRLTRA